MFCLHVQYFPIDTHYHFIANSLCSISCIYLQTPVPFDIHYLSDAIFCNNELVFLIIMVLYNMKFSRHENVANFPFCPILAPNPCIFLHRGGFQLRKLWPFKADNVSPYPLGYPPREFVKISCTRTFHVLQ